VEGRGWKHDRGWQVRSRSRSGAEGKQKYASYTEARAEAMSMAASGSFKEIWVEEVGVVPRAWRDLSATSSRSNDDRAHVLSIEEEES
jgi:hypothetical protein